MEKKKQFSKLVSDFQENEFLSRKLMLTNSRYTVKNLISKLAPIWLTNVHAIDLVFFLGQTLWCKSIQNRC